jgi:hypothetical protein
MKDDKKGKEEMDMGLNMDPVAGMDYMPQMPQMPQMSQMSQMQQMPYMPYMPQTQQMPYMPQMPQTQMTCCPYLVNMQCPVMNNQNLGMNAANQMMPGNQYMGSPMMPTNQFMTYPNM